MPNQALEQTRDSVLRYGAVIGCELLNFIVLPMKTITDTLSRMYAAVVLTIKVLCVCVAVLAALAAIPVIAEAYFRASGSDRLLEAIRKIHPGLTKPEVLELMGREPSITPADYPPQWIEDSVPNKSHGEFWYFFMGYPPRNLIIYFDENERVSCTTWAPT